MRLAVYSMLPGVSNLHFDRARPELKRPATLVVTKGDATISLPQLSDGERSLIALFAEIARRGAAVNPDAPLEAELVVLIDESDAHLHPRWQVEVIPALQRTFPNAQFVLTTHSPLALMHVPARSVRLLKSFELVSVNHVAEGRDARDLLIDVFEAPMRPRGYQDRLDALGELIDSEDTAAARAELEKLHNEIGPNDGELGRLGSLLSFLEI